METLEAKTRRHEGVKLTALIILGVEGGRAASSNEIDTLSQGGAVRGITIGLIKFITIVCIPIALNQLATTTFRFPRTVALDRLGRTVLPFL